MLLSVVIITKNEGHIIKKTLESIQSITDDIVIVDSGSRDNTVAICQQFNATVIETDWQGYGNNKNKGIDAAKHDWILSLDADEALDNPLANSIKGLELNDIQQACSLQRRNFFCGKLIRFGEWAGDKTIRIFNRKNTKWDNTQVHERLIFSQPVKVTKLKGNLLHYTVNSIEDYINKTVLYAKLNAEKYYDKRKKSTAIKLILSPWFAFVKHYFWGLGFLDGWHGYFIAKTNAWYIFLKYSYLRDMYKNKHLIK